jgi:hypothetical protein
MFDNRIELIKYLESIIGTDDIAVVKVGFICGKIELWEVLQSYNR